MRHSEIARAEAIGLGMTLGADEAAERTGIPRRTISRWLRDPRLVASVADTPMKETIAARLWEAVQVGTEAVLAGLADPRASLGHKARALEVVAEQHALLTGGPTSRIATVDPEGDAWLEAVGPLTDDERAELDAAITRTIEDWLDAHRGFASVSAPVVPRLTDGSGMGGP